MIYLDPFSLQEGQSLCLPQEVHDLILGKRQPIHGERRNPCQKRIQSQQRRPILTQLDRKHNRTGFFAPPVRNTAENACLLQGGNVLQQLICFLRTQTQRMKQFPAVHQAANQRRYLCGSIQTGKQFQQFCTIVPILRQRILQGDMFHPSVFRFGSICRKKSKGI